MKKLRMDHSGFSLVEMLVVMGIIGILAVGSLSLLRHIRLADNEKVVKSITNAITKQQVRSMSKEQKPYLYIYKVDGVYYCLLSTTDCSSFDSSVMNASDGTLLGNGCDIYSVSKGGTGTKVEGNVFIKLEYNRDGSFAMDDATGCHGILVDAPSRKTNIKLLYASGKHVIE